MDKVSRLTTLNQMEMLLKHERAELDCPLGDAIVKDLIERPTYSHDEFTSKLKHYKPNSKTYKAIEKMEKNHPEYEVIIQLCILWYSHIHYRKRYIKPVEDTRVSVMRARLVSDDC